MSGFCSRYTHRGRRLTLAVVLVLSIVLLTACGEKKTTPTAEPNSEVNYDRGADLTGVVRTIDTANGVVTFYNPVLDADETFLYNSATSIQSVNSEEMVMEEVSEGEVYDLYLDQPGGNLSMMRAKSDVVEETDARVIVDPDRGMLTIDGATYSYSNAMVALSDGKAIDPMEVTSMDRVTFRGAQGRAYSLIVTQGHGYIEPTEYADFIGGTLTVQGEAILPVTEGMLLTVPEGRQTIYMRNGDLESQAVASVTRNQVAQINMKDSMTQRPNTARVTFHIHPEGAEVYVNGTMVDATKPVPMYYGVHSLRVVLEGYNTYQGTMQIRDPEPVIRIDLAEEVAKVEDSDSDTESDSDTSTPDPARSEVMDDDGTTQTPSSVDYDVDHKITVSAPDGASVYINGSFKGVAPCEFTKCLGEVTITLQKEGYETKSYSMDIIDDSEDTTISFPDLKANG
ncbi:MAG: PEGA domain-containing protein [Eubacterium sp.]|nr:PEGA domain-containing protein [Eubacterium sp.]